jgi:hypothetical protein
MIHTINCILADIRVLLLVEKSILGLAILMVFTGCKKSEEKLYPQEDRTIQITDKIFIDNGERVKDSYFSYQHYDDFLNYISTSDHFLIVQLKDFKKTHSTDKVVLAMRYDIDDNIDAAVKFAYREKKYGIRSTYFVLPTNTYYSVYNGTTFTRNNNIIYYLKKIQDDFGHEIGFHNDLITIQLMYGLSSKLYLRDELAFLRGNNLNIVGTTYHGSQYCYIYHYYNAYFWYEYPDNGWNYEYITKGFKTIKIEKDSLPDYNFEYEGGLLGQDYFWADCNFVNGKRWNMNMVNLDTIKPGKKVIILLHPANWD